MKRLFAVLLLLSVTAAAADLFPVREVKPGMKGWGLTWTQGPGTIRFEAEIVGVLEGFVPGTPVVLARLSHPELEKSGVFAGMSGSPVYIGERLLGAVAYTWSFLKEPVAGITPAEVMKGDLGGTAGLKAVDTAALLQASFRDVPALLKDVFRAPLPEGAALAPLAFQAEAIPTAFAGLFSSLALAPAEGVAGPEPPAYPLDGGYPIGAALAWGDASFFASGTITFREGDTLYAFGHPFMGVGEAAFPLMRAHPVAVLARAQTSFRFSNPGSAVGMLERDGLNGIRAAIGKTAPSVPVELTINGHTSRFSTVRHPLITPIMAANGMATLLQKEIGPGPFGTMALTVILKPAGGETLVFKECFSGPGAIDGLTGAALLYPIVLGANPYRPVLFDSITYAVTHDPIDRRERITGAAVDKGLVRPGEAVTLTVHTEDLQGRSGVKTYPITIPSGVLPETFTLLVGSGKDIEEQLKKVQPVKPLSYEGLVRVLQDTRAEADLTALWKLNRSALLDDDRLYPFSNPDLTARMPGAIKLPITVVKTLLETRPYPLEGTVEIKFKTRD